MKLVTGLVKDRLLGYMGPVLHVNLWQGKEPGVGQGTKASFDKELLEVVRMAEGDQGGGKEGGCKWRDQIRGCGNFL